MRLTKWRVTGIAGDVALHIPLSPQHGSTIPTARASIHIMLSMLGNVVSNRVTAVFDLSCKDLPGMQLGCTAHLE